MLQEQQSAIEYHDEQSDLNLFSYARNVPDYASALASPGVPVTSEGLGLHSARQFLPEALLGFHSMGWVSTSVETTAVRIVPKSGLFRGRPQYYFVDADHAKLIAAEQLFQHAAELIERVSSKIDSVKAANATKKVATAQELEFTPSKELMDVLFRGIDKFASRIQVENRSDALKVFLDRRSREQTAQLFTRVLMDLIATISFRQADGRYDAEPLTSSGEFALAYLNAFPDVFPVWPTDLPDFQTLLMRDLFDFLSQGGVIKGGWGELFVQRKDIGVRLRKGNVTTIQGDWEPAEGISG